MVLTPKYQLIEDRLNRDLAGQLRTWGNAGVSCPAIARLLYAETRVLVVPETIRKWLRGLEDAA